MDVAFAGLAVLVVVCAILVLLERLIRSEGPMDPPGCGDTRQP